jgi:uncharacterized protein
MHGSYALVCLTLFFLVPWMVGCSPITEAATRDLAPTSTTEDTPYRCEIFDPVEFTSDDISLVGRIYMPITDEVVPGIVMVHGSGRRTRDESQRLATDLAEAGFAVLRYDKRGVGDSGGVYSGVGPMNSEWILGVLAEDALAGIRFLGKQEGVDAKRIGLFGNSQAGWIIPLAAARSKNVKFAVLVVSPAVSVGEENYYSLLTGEDPTRLTEESLEAVSANLAEFSGQRGFDPRGSIEAMDIPALWVLGGHDASIPTRETVQILEKIQAEFGKPFDIHIYKRGTHNLVDFETQAHFDFMGEIVLEWLLETVGKIQ